MKTIKLKYKDTYIDNITPGLNLFEISKLVQKDFDFPIIVAKVNNQVVDLSTIVTQSGTVEFFDRSSTIGNRTYGRSLEFLITVATKEKMPDADVLINYSLDNGIYCEIVGQKITKTQIEAIEEKMREICKEKLLFVKSTVSRFDAIKHFTQNKQMDKVRNLNYNSTSTIVLHKLNNIYDYFFGPLVYDTGQINKFRFTYLGKNSLVISYPTTKNPETVEKYMHHEKIFERYKEYQNWGRTVGLSIVADLNDLGGKGEYTDGIRLFETYYESQLSEVAEKISQNKKLKLILMSGPSSSGKTTSSKKIALYLRAKGLKPHRISLDDYFIDRDKTPLDKNGNYDFANIKATDVKLFNNHLDKLMKGEKVCIPRFDFITGKKIFEDNYIQLKEEDVLIVEGIHTINDLLTKNVPKEKKFKIFITPVMQLKIDNHNRVRTTDVRKLRRIVRDARFRGNTAEDTLKMWPNVDKEAVENIYPFQDNVDFVINSALSYEIGVLRTFAEPLLYGIDSKSEVYPEAIRLINLLRQFLPISSESVPKDSILREFIGEGIFN